MTPEAPAARGPYAKGIARRQEILDRAIEVFAQRGSNRTSLRAIATEVGVTHAALTHHFGSLEELLVAVYLASNDAVHESPALPDDATPAEIMLSSAEANREVPGLVQLYTSLMATAIEEGHDPARMFANEWFSRLRVELAERIRANQEAGRIRRDVDPETVASLVVAASDGLQIQWLVDADAPQREALRLLDDLLRPLSD